MERINPDTQKTLRYAIKLEFSSLVGYILWWEGSDGVNRVEAKNGNLVIFGNLSILTRYVNSANFLMKIDENISLGYIDRISMSESRLSLEKRNLILDTTNIYDDIYKSIKINPEINGFYDIIDLLDENEEIQLSDDRIRALNHLIDHINLLGSNINSHYEFCNF